MTGGGSSVLPVLVEPDALGQVFGADLLHRPVWVVLFKTVDVIALGVELFAGQIGQAVDVIAIVKAVPGQGKRKFPRVQLFQTVFLLLGQGVEAQGLALCLGVQLQCLEHGTDVPLAGRPEIAGAGTADSQVACIGGDLLVEGVPPGEDIGKRILTAAVTGGEEVGVHQVPIRQFWCEKLNHNGCLPFSL